MRIYLCRVREREDGSLYIERNPDASASDEYIAISHVWGSPDTIQAVKIDGMDEPVSLSPGKISILEILRRPDVCGSAWFWMDIFCLDQSPNAAISMADQLASIPTIYKRSSCVKVLIESPVCPKWTMEALQSAEYGTDEDTFGQWELLHARKCRFMLFADPWFERLWTRQEGLYATQIQTVLLDPRDCPRYSTVLRADQKWVFEGISSEKRYAVQAFVYDKLQYHGHIQPPSSLSFRLYVDLVYRGGLDMRKYPPPGQRSQYSPIDSAWRSGRKTTKPRDYVLAVFPDFEGYTVPPNARSLSFENLLQDALQQLPQLECSAKSAVKVTQGTLEMRDANGNSILPFIPQAPSDITEAYDTYSIVPRLPDGETAKQTTLRHTLNCDGEDLDVVAQDLTITRPSFTQEHLQELVSIWETSADTSSQLLNCPLSSPCTAAKRAINSEEGLHHRAFAFEFCQSPIEKWAADEGFEIGIRHGVVDLKQLAGVREEDYELYLTRFMACLMCGVTLKNAMAILGRSEFRMLVTPQGKKLLALINKECLKDDTPARFVLLSRGMTKVEGLHVGVKLNGDSCAIVGRTWIPRDE